MIIIKINVLLPQAKVTLAYCGIILCPFSLSIVLSVLQTVSLAIVLSALQTFLNTAWK
jgi:hypothetical protein